MNAQMMYSVHLKANFEFKWQILWWMAMFLSPVLHWQGAYRIVYLTVTNQNPNVKSPPCRQTVLRPANVRKFDPIQKLVIGLAESEVPCFHYHRNCRSLFKMKSTLNSILSKEQFTSQASTLPESLVSDRRSSTDRFRVYDPVCISTLV